MNAPRPVVFVIDDDASVRRALERLLRVEGFSVRTFASGSAFLGALDAACTGCAVLDVRMPDLSGFEILDRLAARGCTLPVILITGHGDLTMAARAQHLGCVSFLRKPFEDVALLEAVRRALRCRREGDGAETGG
jgi:two-component system response regulator FixJ